MNNKLTKSYIILEIPVQWGDMDAAQHVNNAVYLRWVESARIMMFQKMQNGSLDFEKIIPILAWQDCKYIYPVTYPDLVTINLDVVELLDNRVLCVTKIYSKKHDRIVAISKSHLVAFDRMELKKQTIPESWRKSIVDFYGETILK